MNLSSKEISCADTLAGNRIDKRTKSDITDAFVSELHFALYDDKIDISKILVHKV